MNVLKVAYGKMLRLQQDVHTFVVYMCLLMHLIIKIVYLVVRLY